MVFMVFIRKFFDFVFIIKYYFIIFNFTISIIDYICYLSFFSIIQYLCYFSFILFIIKFSLFLPNLVPFTNFKVFILMLLIYLLYILYISLVVYDQHMVEVFQLLLIKVNFKSLHKPHMGHIFIYHLKLFFNQSKKRVSFQI